MKRGCRTKYDPGIHPWLAKWMARCGLTDEEIAKELKISVATLYRWKKKYNEFCEALKENKNIIDAQVEDALLKRALGYEYEETEITANKDGKSTRIKKYKKHVLPDVTAQIFWLKNRQPILWRDKRDDSPTNNSQDAIDEFLDAAILEGNRIQELFEGEEDETTSE